MIQKFNDPVMKRFCELNATFRKMKHLHVTKTALWTILLMIFLAPQFAQAQTISANLEGVALGVGSVYTTTVSSTHAETKLLTVTATFDAGLDGKSVKITLADGLKFSIADGMNGSPATGGTWNFSTAALTGLQTAFVTGVAYTKPATVLGYQPLGGTLEYALTPGTESIMIQIRVVGDIPFLLSDGTKTFNDWITVEQYQSNTLVNSEKLDNYVMTGSLSFSQSNNFSPSNIYSLYSNIEIPKMPDDTWHHTVTFLVRGNGMGDYYLRYLFNPWELSVRVPKEVGITSVSSSTFTILSQSIDNSNGAYDLLNITLQSANSSILNNPSFTFNGKVPVSASPGTYSITTVSSSITLVDGSVLAVNPTIAFTLKVQGAGELLSLYPLNNTPIHPDEANTPAEYLKLGGFYWVNENPNIITDRRAKMEFDMGNTGNIGVQAVILDSNPTNISVKTTTARTITPPDQSSATLNLTSQLAAGEYIASVEWDLHPLASGDEGGNPTNMQRRNIYSYSFYGRLLLPDDYSAKLTIFNKVAGAWTELQCHTESFAVNPGPKGVDYTITVSGNGTVVQAGSTRTLSTTFNTYSYRYTGAGSMISALKGFEVYVREPEGMIIDPTSIQATYNGITYSGTGYITNGNDNA